MVASFSSAFFLVTLLAGSGAGAVAGAGAGSSARGDPFQPVLPFNPPPPPNDLPSLDTPPSVVVLGAPPSPPFEEPDPSPPYRNLVRKVRQPDTLGPDVTGDAPIVPDEIPVGKMLVRQGQGGGGGGGKAGKGGKAGGGEEGGEVAANNATAVAKGIPNPKGDRQGQGQGGKGQAGKGQGGKGQGQVGGGLGQGQGQGQQGQAGLNPPRSVECSQDLPCGKYHFCQFGFFGSICRTHLRDGRGSCEGRRGHPEHFRCDRSRFSVQRCFAEAGFQCTNAYFMPCVPGDRQGCPRNFRCRFHRFGLLRAPVCKPRERQRPTNFCRSDFDCGYSPALGSWQTCSGGRCNIIIVD